MNIRRVLALVAIPFVIGTFGFIAPNQANAATPSHRNVEISQQPNRPQMSDKKPQIRHSKPHQNLKKPSPQRPQAHNQGKVQNSVEQNNR